jgi:hypothetical protein
MLKRGSKLESDVNLIYHKNNWNQWAGVMLQRWGLHVVYTEIAFPYPDFDVPAIGAKKITIEELDNDIVEVVGAPQTVKRPTPALGLENYVKKKQISKMQVVKDTWLKVVRKKKSG